MLEEARNGEFPLPSLALSSVVARRPLATMFFYCSVLLLAVSLMAGTAFGFWMATELDEAVAELRVERMLGRKPALPVYAGDPGVPMSVFFLAVVTTLIGGLTPALILAAGYERRASAHKRRLVQLSSMVQQFLWRYCKPSICLPAGDFNAKLFMKNS